MSDEIEQKEINLDTPNGWETFLQFATEAYDELLGLVDTHAEHAGIERLRKAGSDAFDSLETLARTAVQKIEEGNSISYDDSDRAQLFYDTITDSRDELAELLESLEQGPSDLVEAVEPENNEVKEMTSSVESASVAAPTPATEVKKPESTPSRASASSLKDERDSLAVLNEAYKTIIALEISAQTLVSEYEDKISLDTDSAQQFAFAQLKKTQTRIVDIKKELESGTVEITPVAADNIKHAVEEIETNITQLRHGLEPVTSFPEAASVEPKNGPMTVVEETDSVKKPVTIAVLNRSDEKVALKKLEAPRTKRAFASKDSIPKKNIVPEVLTSDPYYKTFMKAHGVTWNQVEKAMVNSITKVEKKSRFDEWFNVNHGSMFATVLAPMTMRELSLFEEKTHESISAFLLDVAKKEGAQFTYTTYRKWLHRFDEMAEVVPLSPDMTFAEVCALYELILLMPVEM